MTTLQVPVDDELLIIQFLTAQFDVAAVVSGRVSTTVAPPYPRVRVQRLGGFSPPPQRLDHPRVQFDCYGSTQYEAKHLSAVVRAALPTLVGVHPLGTVTEVREIAGPQWLPDPTPGAGMPTLPRYIFTFVFTIHPNT